MAFSIANAPKTPDFKPDYSPADRQINYGRILDYVNQYLPSSPVLASDITFDASTKKANISVETPKYGTLSYQWKYGADKEHATTSIDGATSAEVTLTSTQSEKYLVCAVTNTLNGVAATETFDYGVLPVIS